MKAEAISKLTVHTQFCKTIFSLQNLDFNLIGKCRNFGQGVRTEEKLPYILPLLYKFHSRKPLDQHNISLEENLKKILHNFSGCR